MSKKEILKELADAVIVFSPERARLAAELALKEKVDPVEAINQGLIIGMGIISDKYAVREIYLPQVLVAAHAMYEGLNVLTPAIPKKSLGDSRTALTAVVEGDVHDIGKNIVKTMLTAGGYIVNDLGNDVPPIQISNEAKETSVNAVCISTLMTPTLANMEKTVKLMFDNGYRDKCIVTIGGPPTSEEFAEEIGADHRDDDAQACVKYVTGRLNEIKR